MVSAVAPGRASRAAAPLLALFLLTACASDPKPPPSAENQALATPPHVRSASSRETDPRLEATLWYQRASEARLVAAQSYALAGLRLAQALRESGSAALEQADGGQGKPPAVVFDVDETVLDNSSYQARLISGGISGFDRAAWDRWIAERHAAAIPGATAFVQALRAARVRPIFI